jgi:hypothetical protein
MKRTLLAVALCAAGTFSTVAFADMTLYEHDNFQGRRVQANGTIENLANSGFNDRAESVVIRSGDWQLCDDAYFRGRCVTLRPGEYPSLGQMGMNDRISSAREVGGWGPAPQAERGERHDWGHGSRVILYSNPNFQGERYVVNGDYLRDLANTGFNDRAQSMRVEGGYWMFCSDAAFQGRCRTFGPGDYAQLPGVLNNQLSSGRRISEEYPYNQQPRWQQGAR